jgi:hypothetical protein
LRPAYVVARTRPPNRRRARQHHPPQTPLQRLLATGVLSEETAEPWRELQRRSDPVALLTTIRRCQGQLAVLANAEQGSGLQASRVERDLAAENRSLEVFLGGLQALWQNNQPRRRKPKPRTGKRSRPDPFEPDVERIEQWLQGEPQLRAKTLLERLIDHNPPSVSKEVHSV